MSTATLAAPSRDHAPSGRIRNVIRLQYVNRTTFIWTPLMVLGAAWVLTIVIFALLSGNGIGEVKTGGGSQAPMWYFFAVGLQAMTLTFPFSQALSITRREFFLGTLASAALASAGLAVVFVLLGLVEKSTDGYGVNGYFAYMPWVWQSGAVAAALSCFTVAMFAFTVGFWGATLFKRFGVPVLMLILVGLAAVMVGIVAIITLSHSWVAVGEWFTQTGSLGLTLWLLALTAVMTAGSYLTLRGMRA